MLVIDAETETVSALPCNIASGYKYEGIVAAGGRLFGVPRDAPSVLMIEDRLADWGLAPGSM